MSALSVARRIRASGRVQGVNFRYHARQKARSLELTGYVRNLPDGSVEALASGPGDAVEAFTDWMRSGPPSARVDRLESEEIPYERHPSFEIRQIANRRWSPAG